MRYKFALLLDALQKYLKAKGDDEASHKEYDRIRVEFGKREQSMEMYYDHWQWFGEYELVEWLKAPSDKDVIIIEE